MREKESKIRLTKEDLKMEAASKAEGSHSRPKPRPPSGKLRTESSAAKAQAQKLRFESSDVDPVSLEKPVRHVRPVRAAGAVISGKAHAKTAEYENDNVGVEALNETEGMAEIGARKVTSGHYSRKLKQSDKADMPEGSSDLHFEEGPDLRSGSHGTPGNSPAAEAFNGSWVRSLRRPAPVRPNGPPK